MSKQIKNQIGKYFAQSCSLPYLLDLKLAADQLTSREVARRKFGGFNNIKNPNILYICIYIGGFCTEFDIFLQFYSFMTVNY